MNNQGGKAELDRADMIRLNQLVRTHTNEAELLRWYHRLATCEQMELIRAVVMCAIQAGVDSQTVARAIASSRVREVGEFVRLHPDGFTLHGSPISTQRLMVYIAKAEAPVRLEGFRFLIHLFGEAERQVLALEGDHDCNHWWHRDLLDAGVVDDLMRQSKFFMTTKRDDARAKTGKPAGDPTAGSIPL